MFSISRELIRLVGGLESLRPVLQSLLHRMLLYPPPQHRLDAIKSLKDVRTHKLFVSRASNAPLFHKHILLLNVRLLTAQTLSKPERLLDLAGPTMPDTAQQATVVVTASKRSSNNIAPLKL